LFETRNVFLQCEALGSEIREGRIEKDDEEFKKPRIYVGMEFKKPRKYVGMSTTERQAGREGGRQRQRDALHLSVSSSRS